jgi:acylphosphatase
LSTVFKALRCLVAGRVQGVYYRAATAARAQQLGLHGSVRNLPDGRVEVIVKGEAAELAELAAWLWQGPPAARVEAVQVEEWQAPVAEGFVVAP